MELANYYHSDDPSRKHIKLGEGGGGKHNPIDFISDLPDSLILHILSFLHARDAIRTTTLSRRWQGLWMDNLALDFNLYQLIGEDYYMDPDVGPGRFISFVNCTLLFHRSAKIDKMVVEMCYEKSFANDINAWILFAMKKSVNELQLHFPIPDDDDYGEDMKPVLPFYTFNGPCLVTLKITYCSFEGYRLLNWKSLRNLSLNSVVLNNNLIRDILSGSPVLETMVLTSCVDFDYIHIESKNLAKLAIMNYKSNANGLKISAPYLRSLLITGGFNGHSVSLINTSASLVDVTIAYCLIYTVADFERSHEMFSKSMRQLVEKIRHVKNLTIGRSCFQVLSMILIENAQPFPFSNLVCLQMHLSLRQAELHALFRLLMLTPILDKLLLYMTPINPCPMVENLWSRISSNVNSKLFWAPRQSLLAATLLNIKIVTILNFDGSKGEMKLIAVFLKYVRGLVNMIIQSTDIFCPRLQESLQSIVTQSEGVWTFAPSKRLPNTVILSRGRP